MEVSVLLHGHEHEEAGNLLGQFTSFYKCIQKEKLRKWSAARFAGNVNVPGLRSAMVA